MPRRLRMLDDPGGLVEISSRVMQGLFLMRPCEEVNDLILGVLGRAQAKFGVVLHAFVFLSNHFHILATVEDTEQMARFCEFLKSNLAKELGTLYDWKEKFWGKRYHSASVKLSVEDQVRRFFYILDNGCKEGLVASPLDWPGVTSARALYRGETTMTGTWYDRTAQCRARQRGEHRTFPSKETVRLTPLPFLERVSLEEQIEFVRSAVRAIEERTARMHADNATKPLGTRGILRQSPRERANPLKRSPSPPFHASDPSDYREMKDSRAIRVAAYRAAASRLKRGETGVTFPEGCFPPRLPFVKARAPGSQ